MKLKFKRLKIHTIDDEKYIGGYYPSGMPAIFHVYDMKGQALLSLNKYARSTRKVGYEITISS